MWQVMAHAVGLVLLNLTVCLLLPPVDSDQEKADQDHNEQQESRQADEDDGPERQVRILSHDIVSVGRIPIHKETVPVQGEILQLSTILGQTQEFLIDDNLVRTPSQKREVTLSIYPSVVAWRDRSEC